MEPPVISPTKSTSVPRPLYSYPRPPATLPHFPDFPKHRFMSPQRPEPHVHSRVVQPQTLCQVQVPPLPSRPVTDESFEPARAFEPQDPFEAELPFSGSP